MPVAGFGKLSDQPLLNRSVEETSELSSETLAGFLLRSLACPKCRGQLVAGSEEYWCRSCKSAFSRTLSYVDFLDLNDPMLATAQIDFTDHYVPQQTPYWAALRQATEKVSAAMPAFYFELFGCTVRCLDIGVSHVVSGRVKPHIRAYEQLFSVYCAIDPDPSQLACKDDRLFFARAVGERLPFADGAFDLVLIDATLDHCFDYKKALDEIARVLAPGGVAGIYMTNERSWAKRLLPWEARKRRQLAAGHHNVFLGPDVLAKEMRHRGFDVLLVWGMRYLLLPSAVLEALAHLCGQWTPRIIGLIDRVGNWMAPALGGDFRLIVRKRHRVPA